MFILLWISVVFACLVFLFPHAYIHLFDAFLVALSSTLVWHVDMIVHIIAAFPLVPSRI